MVVVGALGGRAAVKDRRLDSLLPLGPRVVGFFVEPFRPRAGELFSLVMPGCLLSFPVPVVVVVVEEEALLLVLALVVFSLGLGLTGEGAGETTASTGGREEGGLAVLPLLVVAGWCLGDASTLDCEEVGEKTATVLKSDLMLFFCSSPSSSSFKFSSSTSSRGPLTSAANFPSFSSTLASNESTLISMLGVALGGACGRGSSKTKLFSSREGEGIGDFDSETPIFLFRRLVGVTGEGRSSLPEETEARVFTLCVDLVELVRLGGTGEVWSGDRSLMGCRHLEKRWKLGDLVKVSSGLEESRLTLAMRGPAGLLTED